MRQGVHSVSLFWMEPLRALPAIDGLRLKVRHLPRAGERVTFDAGGRTWTAMVVVVVHHLIAETDTGDPEHHVDLHVRPMVPYGELVGEEPRG